MPPHDSRTTAHAFCYSCVDDEGIVDDFCKAAVIRTKSLYGASAVFKYLDSYWCDAEIISDIENGAFGQPSNATCIRED